MIVNLIWHIFLYVYEVKEVCVYIYCSFSLRYIVMSRMTCIVNTSEFRDVWKTEIRFGFGFQKTEPSKNLTSVPMVFR